MTSYFDRVPDEIICDIILRLLMVDILRCRMVSVRLNLIIQNSIAIQYKIELAAHGFVACPDSTLSTATSIRMLKEQQAAWQRCEWKEQRVVHLPPGCCTHDFRNGIMAFGRPRDLDLTDPPLPLVYATDITCLRLASGTTSNNNEEKLSYWSLHLGIVIRDFIIDPLIDLLVLVEQTMDSTTVPFRVHILKLSNGQPHEMAAKHILNFEMDLSNSGTCPAVVRVQGFYAGVLVQYGDTEDFDHFVVWNWRTGEKQLQMNAEEYSFEDFAFLSARSVILAVNGPTVTLQFWCFDASTAFHVGSFALPLLQKWRSYTDMRFDGGPFPTLAKTLDGTPFALSPEPEVLAVSFGVMETDTYSTMKSYSIVMRLSFMFDALGMRPPTHGLCMCNGIPPGGSGRTLEWEAWGPKCTRWIPHTRQLKKWHPCLIGGRFAVITNSDLFLSGITMTTSPVIRLYDFRPEIVGRYEQSHPQDVRTAPSVLHTDLIFRENITSTLPFHVVTSKALPSDMSGVMIDERRLICRKAEEIDDEEWRTLFIYDF